MPRVRREASCPERVQRLPDSVCWSGEQCVPACHITAGQQGRIAALSVAAGVWAAVRSAITHAFRSIRPMRGRLSAGVLDHAHMLVDMLPHVRCCLAEWLRVVQQPAHHDRPFHGSDQQHNELLDIDIGPDLAA